MMGEAQWVLEGFYIQGRVHSTSFDVTEHRPISLKEFHYRRAIVAPRIVPEVLPCEKPP